MVVDFYVDNGSSREAVFSQVMQFKSETPGDWQHFHVAVTNGTLDAFAGQTLGVRFRGAGDAGSRDRRTLHRVGSSIRGNGEDFHLAVRNRPEYRFPVQQFAHRISDRFRF